MNGAEQSGSGQHVSGAPEATALATHSALNYHQIPAWINEVGPGWEPILVALHQDLLSLNPDYRVFQVKEKFGSLRVYLDDPMTPEMDQAVHAAETLSAQICEVCGASGRVRNVSQFYVRCLCDTCGPIDMVAAKRRREELQHRP